LQVEAAKALNRTSNLRDKRLIGTRKSHVNNTCCIMATLRSLAMNALRLDGFWSITEGLAALAHDIRGMLELLGWREAAQPQASG